MAASHQWVDEVAAVLAKELTAQRAEALLIEIMTVPTTPNKSTRDTLTRLLERVRGKEV